jgi:16S rRNA (guanine527-N7)-methyltransferase
MGISVMDSRYSELARMIEGWPGLVSRPALPLIEDCLVLLDHLDAARTLVDVGSGGGLPGLALKLARPELDVTLIEADQAKAAFLVQAAARLGLGGVDVVARRAEEAGRERRYRERFDVAVARAVAALPALVELCLPLVRVGGRMLAQKTANEDPSVAARAVELLGGALEQAAGAPSPARGAGTVVVIAKIATTPQAYPRRAGVPVRKPL